MDPASAEALVAAFNEFNADAGASVAVLWGEGGAFCAGFDLKHAASRERGRSPLDALAYPDDEAAPLPRGPMGPTRLELDKPVIAAVAGPAVAGGFEIALWCDVRVMEESAYFGVYCRRWGVPLIDGGTVRLPRIVGMGRAIEIILTGRKVPAEEALRINLCEQVVPEGKSREGRRQWRTRSRAFRRPACAPTGARSTPSRECRFARGCAGSGTTGCRPSTPKARRARRASPQARGGTATSATSERYRKTVPPSTMIV